MYSDAADAIYAEANASGAGNMYGVWEEGKLTIYTYSDISNFKETGSVNEAMNASNSREGLWIDWVVNGGTDNEETYSLQYRNGKLIDKSGKEYTGKNAYFCKVRDQLNSLKEIYSDFDIMISTLENSNNLHTITNYDPRKDGTRNYSYPTGHNNSEIFFDPWNFKNPDNPNQKRMDTRIGLIHELVHSFDSDQSIFYNPASIVSGKYEINMNEIKAVNFENILRLYDGEPQRKSYSGAPIPERYLTSSPNLW